MNGYVVVDASLAIKWVLNEPYADEALALASEWASTETRPVAPCLLLAEATNVLHRRAVLGHISPAHAKELLTGLLDIGIEVSESRQIHIRALELAQQLKTPAVYDTHYLALADILGCDLWTADEQFFNLVRDREPRVKWLRQLTVRGG
ncbi:MAG: type II toxin-antitoxin system VapC family toxin [Chloroflexi bacterium]|nr:type II toxin-antitoxin system VapC family toxin [Chloroflexota bacterium]